MTLQESLDHLSASPTLVVAFFSLIPITALIAGFMGKNEGHIAPWKYLYSTLLYLVCVPGIFAVALALFGNKSLYQTDVISQIIPIASMVVTMMLVRNNVNLERIPGFGNITGLVMMIACVFVIMWIAEKTHIIVFSSIRIQYLLLFLVAMLIALRVGWSKMMNTSKR